MTQTSPSILIDVEEAAAMTGKTPGAFRWAIHNGTAPPSALIMGRRDFRRADVLAWIDKQFEEQNESAA